MNGILLKRATVSLMVLVFGWVMFACSDDKKDAKPLQTFDTDSNFVTDADADSDSDADSDADSDSDTDSDSDSDVETAVLKNISIAHIEVYQSVQVPLVRDRQLMTPSTPIVQDRDAMMRIYVNVEPGWVGQNVTARLTMEYTDGATEQFEGTRRIGSSSMESELNSTLNIDIPATAIVVGAVYHVELLNAELQPSVGTEEQTRWPTEGTSELLIQNPNGALQVVILPIRWLSDGSNRLPATDDNALANIKNALMELYPISDINLVVSATPLDWSDALDADGTGWDELLNAVTLQRYNDGVNGSVYYIGMFRPMELFYSWDDPENAYCNYACVTGLSWQATAVTDTLYRASIVLGYDEESIPYTVAHEMGHAHGRGHAPSGGADYVDTNYPVGNGTLDVLGYGTRLESLFSTGSYFDFMGYDYPQWVSAYTYSGLFDMIVAVNAMYGAYMSKQVHTAPAPSVTWRQILIAMDGTGSFGIEIAMPTAPSGKPVEIDLYDDTDTYLETVIGTFTPFADQPGGAVWYAPSSSDAAVAVIPEWELRVE